jgi:DNA-binding response OmpR family regulator
VALVIDDERARGIIGRRLEQEGFAVATASGRRPGSCPRDSADRRHPDDLAQVPVIVVTAKDLTAEDHKRLNGEVDNILQKGDYDREKLMDEVHRYVNRAHAA